MKSISAKALKGLMNDNRLNIIDVRSNYEYIYSTINGSVNIEAYELLINPSKCLKYNETYYLFCNSGFTSKNVISKLNYLGYDLVNIEGGYKAYLNL